MTEALVDSSYFYSLFSLLDRNHTRTLEFSKHSEIRPLVPDIILPEVTFLFHREGGVPSVAGFMRTYSESGSEPLSLRLVDIYRAQAIMTAYTSADLDFVDCALWQWQNG